jgi:hypothetical protein
MRFCFLFKIFFVLCTFAPLTSKAQFVDLNILSFSDTFTTSTTNKLSRSIYDIGLGTLMGKGDAWLWGLSYAAGSFSDQSTSTVTYTFTDLGLKIGLFWTKQKSWFNTITYNFQSTAKYNDGTTAVELRGTSIKADIGYAFWPSETMALAVKIFYYAPSFKESVVSGTLTTISYTRALIYPSFSLMVSY